MDISEKLMLVKRSLSHRKARTWITLTAVVIGIVTIVLLTSISNGMVGKIKEEMSKFDRYTIMVIPLSKMNIASAMSAKVGGVKAQLTEKDAERISQLPRVEAVSRVVSGMTNVEWDGKRHIMLIVGVDPEAFKMATSELEIEKGRWFKDNEVYKCVIGADIPNTLNGIDIGKSITVGGKKLKVIGKMSKTGTSFISLDSRIYIPYKTGKEIFATTFPRDRLKLIIVKLKEGTNTSEVEKKIYSILDKNHKIGKEEDRFYSVVTPKSVEKQIDEINTTLNLFLIAISAVSIVVGIVGVTNTMFMAVIERTHEIGTMKAIGVKNKDVLEMYIMETSALTTIGALIGIVIGILISIIISYMGFKTYIDAPLIISIALISPIIGGVVGYFPAKKAISISPTEALRYE